MIENKTLIKFKEDSLLYKTWLTKMPIVIEDDSLIAGPYISPEYEVPPRPGDNFHYPLGMQLLLEKGFAGVRDFAWSQADLKEGNQKEYLQIIAEVYDSIIQVIGTFVDIAKKQKNIVIAENCTALIERAPRTFAEACQLYWFAVIFRINTSTVGRTDQHLYPFYKNDIDAALLDKADGKKWISELLYRFEKRGAGKGDTLQNITLAGKNEKDQDLTNELSYLILETFLEANYLEPKINVRVHKKTLARLWELVAAIQVRGSGLCTVFNDDVIIDSLVEYGRPPYVAANYCADGCTEIILDGVGETAFRYIDCVKAIEYTLLNGEANAVPEKSMKYYSVFQENVDISPPFAKGIKTGDFIEQKSFDDFYEAYLKQIKFQIDEALDRPYNHDESPMRAYTAATMPGVLEDGVEPYSNPWCFHTYGLFVGSLGTAVNSLIAIKKLIFEQKVISKDRLLEALKSNFEGFEDVRSQCLSTEKFGNDIDEVDLLAKDIASKFAGWTKVHTDRLGRSILPGLYNHLFHHTSYYVGATPDGRRHGDAVGEHFSPTPGTSFEGPTAVINSVCKTKTSENIFGSTLHLNLPALALKGGGSSEEAYLESLSKVFCKKGGSVLNVSVLDAQQLREAQNNPEKYSDLIVRVWGFSYYFTALSPEMQEHVITRADIS